PARTPSAGSSATRACSRREPRRRFDRAESDRARRGGSSQWLQLGWSLAAADRAKHGLICELPLLAHASQEQPAAAHIAAAHELRGKEQPLAEHPRERVHVLPRGDAAE